uniref:LisH domain-containing protein n=1 Tax=Ciona savignyi TaxID=51511 RepID=H2ZC59_CIOSA
MLLNSDVARLVLGYLAEENCVQAFNSFLLESSYLGEVLPMLQGIESPNLSMLNVGGKSLLMVLEEYSAMKSTEWEYLRSSRKKSTQEKYLQQMWNRLNNAINAFKSYQLACLLDSNLKDAVVQKIKKKQGVMVQGRPNEHLRDVTKRNIFTNQREPENTSYEPQPLPSIPDVNRRRKARGHPKRLSDLER